MSKKQYWQSLQELDPTPEYLENTSREFEDELPVVDFAEDMTKVQSTGRRDFLKVLGFSVSAAAVATSCKIPVKKAIPYVYNGTDQITNLVPGIAEYFASTYMDGSGVTNILVKTREGRPIKIEGNTEGVITKGATNAKAQASVLGLYDHTRLKFPIATANPGNALEWAALDRKIMSGLSQVEAAGKKIAIVSNTLASPMYADAIAKFKEKYPSTEHVVYDPVSYSAMRKANEVTLGSAVIPSYRFDNADVIVGVNCDFLGTWLSPVEFAEQYGKNRVPGKGNGYDMSRHYQFQSNTTITGASADYSMAIKPSQEKQVLANLYNAIAGGGLSANKLSEGQDLIEKAASDLRSSQGKALVVSGTNDIDCQKIVNAINIALGSYGPTIDIASLNNMKAGDDELFADFVEEMKGGAFGGIIMLEANPVYNSRFKADFETALKAAAVSISLSERIDESGQNATYVLPGHHYLESWNILEPKTGQFCFVQPTIQPLFEQTRPYVESFLNWSGNKARAYDYVHEYAKANIVGGEQGWVNALKSGSATKEVGAALSLSLDGTLSSVDAQSKSASGLEVVLYESIGIGDGTHAGNPYLQEFPDPMMRLTWDNALAIPYEMAEAEGIALWTNNNNKTVPTADLTVNGQTITLPVVVQFGMPSDTVAVAVGYGRSHAGRAAEGIGVDVYPLLGANGKFTNYNLDGASISFNKRVKYRLSLIQVFGTLQEEYALPGKTPKWRGAIVKETNLASYRKDKEAGNKDRAKVLHHLQSPYPEPDFPGHHWGMGVDLNSCIGCGSCVVACSVENNVPVVGKTEVYRGHDMQWIRIDRYYSGDRNNPDVSFQPMMCQHCDHAPCENVCPVNATNHSSEGLNQMAYNRCIGTRYCANNCPYKVRRFNWLDYQAADYFGKFNDNRKGWGAEGQTDYMFDDLTRMVLNPDVTVRSRGVIEKCSFCVQRIQEGKLTAKKEGRPLKDGDIKVACQTACPTHAITFGDLSDKNSVVHKQYYDEHGHENLDRNYHVLEEQHFLPSVGYQVKVRNIDEKPAQHF